MKLTHARAVLPMLVVTLPWSTSGVVSRHLEQARSFFTVLSLLLILPLATGHAVFGRLRHGGAALWLSGLCWSGMFTFFMLALTLTTVANVLVTMALVPLFTALASRIFLAHQIGRRALAGLGLFQLAIPCVLAVIRAQVLRAREVALLGLLEVIFGILLAWLGAGEVPGSNVLVGGSLVIGALVANEAWAWRRRA